MLYLSPLCCMCGSPSVHFNSSRDRCSAGIIVHSNRRTAFPAYLPSSHSYWLLGQVSCFTPREMINQERAQWLPLSFQPDLTTRKTHIAFLFFFILSPPAMHERGSELKFSSINNIHSLSLTISQQWQCGMNALDSADIQLWWIEWRLSAHNAIALPHWAVYFGLIVCCLCANC